MEAAEETLTRIGEPDLANLVESQATLIAQAQVVMEKREANRPITPEDYEVLMRLVN
jgi:hypothetical protein